MKQLVDIYRSRKKEGLYLFLKNGASFDQLPEELLLQFGRAEKSMTIAVDQHRKFVRASASDILRSLEERGFYLQMPPSQYERHEYQEPE